MVYIKKVRNLANEIVDKKRYAWVNQEKCEELAEEISNQKFDRKCVELKFLDVFHNFVFEIFANSVNYCFWYGSDDFRPEGCNSNKLWKIASDNYKKYHSTNGYIGEFYQDFKKAIMSERFPMISERCRHIDEVHNWLSKKLESVKCFHYHTLDEIGEEWFNNPEKLLNDIIENIPGYSNDLFLKRAQVIFINMNRKYGLLSDFVNYMTVPADYHIPRILNYIGAIEYSSSVKDVIRDEQIMPAGSLNEISIRAATIVACDKIAELANVCPAIVDEYLFFRRKEYRGKIHLTITTDY